MKKILISVLLALSALPAAAQKNGAPAAAAGLTACVYDLNGTAAVKKAGGAEWSAAVKGQPLTEGDSVRTGAGAWCEILLKDGSFIKLDGDSETSLEKLLITQDERQLSFSFFKGKALWMAAKLKKKIASGFAVRTPSAVCAVRGTDFAITVSTAGEASIGLFNGEVAVSNGTGEKTLLAGGEANAGTGEIALQRRLSALMKAEERRYLKIKGRVESLRARLAGRGDFIDHYVNRQQKALSGLELRRQEKLKKR